MSMREEEDGKQLRVQFDFGEKVEEDIGGQILAVPWSSDGHKLNEMLSHILERRVSYIYMVADRLVQGSLGKHVGIYGVSTEDVIIIKAIDGGIHEIRKGSDEQQHDWITALLCTEKNQIIIGSYDGTMNNQLVHQGAVKCIDYQPEIGIACSGGADAKIIIQKDTKQFFQGNGHSTSIEAIQFGPGGDSCISADFAGMAFLWRFTTHTQPILTAKLHTQAISDLRISRQENHFYSASWDHTVKLWDYERMDQIHSTSNTGIVFTSLDINTNNANTIAAGGHDGYIRIYDYRLKSALIFKGGHSTSALSALSWRPSDPFTLLAASQDTNLLLWDTRATKPLAHLNISQPNDALLAAAWNGPHSIVAGGKNSTLYTFHLSSSSSPYSHSECIDTAGDASIDEAIDNNRDTKKKRRTSNE